MISPTGRVLRDLAVLFLPPQTVVAAASPAEASSDDADVGTFAENAQFVTATPPVSRLGVWDHAMGQRILMIEDDRKLAPLVHRFLEDHHFEVRWSPDGNAGSREMERFRPDIVDRLTRRPGRVFGRDEMLDEVRGGGDRPHRRCIAPAALTLVLVVTTAVLFQVARQPATAALRYE